MMRAALGFAAVAIGVVYFLGVLPAREIDPVESATYQVPKKSTMASVFPSPLTSPVTDAESDAYWLGGNSVIHGVLPVPSAITSVAACP
jgi:hypothetical protein